MIKNISFSNFMGFREFGMAETFPGITVIVGKNDTGKTGFLKLLYAEYKALELYGRKKKMTEVSFKKELADKLFHVFQPRKTGLGDLVRKGGNGKLIAKMTLGGDDFVAEKEQISFSFGESTTNTLVDVSNDTTLFKEGNNAIFVPAKEVLTAFSAIKAMSNVYFYPGFDDTYNDLISMLDIPMRKDEIGGAWNQVTASISRIFEGELEQIDNADRFVFKKGNSEYAMQLTAEGVKRIGILSTLIKNRQLTSKTVLFLDEPETALHPGAIRELVETLALCSRQGVQIFLTTHNYFVIKQLYNIARRDQQDIQCCSLERDKSGDITHSFCNLREAFPANSIVEEALKMYDEDIKLDLGV